MSPRRKADEDRIEALLAELADRTPPPSEDELRELARSIASTPRVRVAPRRPPAYARWAVAAAAALLLAGFGFGLGSWSTQEGTAGTGVVGLGFLPAKGWTVVQSTSVGRSDAASAVAANVPLHPSSDPRVALSLTRRSLPTHGILVFAIFTARGDPAGIEFSRGVLPLSLKTARVTPSDSSLTYALRASVGAYNVDARVYFGTASPSAETIENAQRQLNRLIVASERVTILARPPVVGRGQRLTLFGSADTQKADEIVTIEAKDCGQSSFRGIAAVRTLEGGGWSTDFVNAGITATFRALWNDERSASVTVQARANVYLRRRGGPVGKRFTVGVGAKLQFWRRHVVIERLDRRLGTWKAFRKVVLTETGSAQGYSDVFTFEDFRVTLPKGTVIRARFPLSQARPCYLAGVSQQIRI